MYEDGLITYSKEVEEKEETPKKIYLSAMDRFALYTEMKKLQELGELENKNTSEIYKIVRKKIPFSISPWIVKKACRDLKIKYIQRKISKNSELKLAVKQIAVAVKLILEEIDLKASITVDGDELKLTEEYKNIVKIISSL